MGPGERLHSGYCTGVVVSAAKLVGLPVNNPWRTFYPQCLQLYLECRIDFFFFSLSMCSLANCQSHTNIHSQYPVILTLIRYDKVSCFEMLSEINIEAITVLKVENMVPFNVENTDVLFHPSSGHFFVCLCLSTSPCKSRSIPTHNLVWLFRLMMTHTLRMCKRLLCT